MNWLKKLFSKKYRKEVIARKEAQLRLEFEQIFIEIEEMFPCQQNAHTYVDGRIGKYGINGSWLTDGFYFDIFLKSKRLGRIYLSKTLFDDSGYITWHCFKDNESVYHETQGKLTRDYFAFALNRIVPKLITSWSENNRIFMLVNTTFADLSQVMKLPIKKEDSDNGNR